LDVLVQLVAT